MNELEVLERAERIRSIPFALRILGVAVLINLIPLGMAFHEYTKDTQLGNSSRYSEDESLPPLEGPFMEKFATVVQYLIQPEQKAKAIWLKIFLVTVPVGYLLIIFGFARGPLRSLTPFFAGLAFATGLNHALLLILWQFPGAFPKAWLLLSGILGLVAVYIGTWKIARRSVLLRTAVQLTASTFLALLVTIAFPFILLGMAWYLVRKRDIPYSDFFAEAGNFYNFLIMSMYPLCFQIIPTILMTKQKGKQETRRAKKKYKKVEAPSYSSELDFDKLRVGDVILSGKPSWNNSAPIQASNVLSCDEDHRYWSHAFIYAGCRPDQKDDPNAPKRNIVESQSNGKGVQEIDMLTGEKVIYEKVDGSEKPAIKSFDENEKLQFNFDEAGNRKKFTPEQRVKFTAREKQLCFEKSYFEEGYYLMVLRPKYVDETTLEKVVEFCRKKDGEGYGYDKWGVSFYALCALVPPMMSGWLESTMAGKIFNVENAYFCSELVVDAFVKEHQQLFDRSPWRVKPLDFWMNAMFEEIDCGYRRIPQNESAKQEVEEQKAYLASLEQKARKMGETASGMEKEQLEGIVEKFRRDAIRVEKGFYPAFPMA